jgi:hypothetical protein
MKVKDFDLLKVQLEKWINNNLNLYENNIRTVSIIFDITESNIITILPNVESDRKIIIDRLKTSGIQIESESLAIKITMDKAHEVIQPYNLTNASSSNFSHISVNDSIVVNNISNQEREIIMESSTNTTVPFTNIKIQGKNGNRLNKEKLKPKKLVPGKEKELSTKTLKQIIDDNDDLTLFKDTLYARLEKFNKLAYTDHNRAEESQKLDRVARLLVGEETCVAVAFDADKGNIILSSNRNDHRHDSLTTKVTAIISKGRNNNTLNVKPITYVYHNDNLVKKVESEEVEYNYKPPQLRLLYKVTESLYSGITSMATVSYDFVPPTLSTSGNLQNEFTISYTEHGIPDLPDVTISYLLSPSISPFDPKYAGAPVEVEGIKGSTKIDLLTRRVEKLVEHLQFIALVALRE